ncbi:MAG TPA: hypothetical protein DCS56_11205 [Alcanivorax sp.]|nr:hypothetical protein [Alcanivorax sp.]
MGGSGSGSGSEGAGGLFACRSSDEDEPPPQAVRPRAKSSSNQYVDTRRTPFTVIAPSCSCFIGTFVQLITVKRCGVIVNDW